jgi:hypothetical protein
LVENPVTNNELDDTQLADDEPEWGATINVDGITYAVSLFWQPMQDPDDPMQEVKETAETILEGADVFCLRTGGAPQYGLGLSEEGHRQGQVAAAISVADAFSDQTSSVSVFEVPEGWWFLAVRNDLILSEEDVLYKNEDDAQRAFFSMMAVPDWGRKVAPNSWGVEGTSELDLSEVLRNTRQVKLQKLSGLRGTKFIAAVGGAALIVLYILYSLISSLFKEDEVKIKKRPDFSKFRKPVIQKPKTIEKEVMPWENIYKSEDVLQNCWEKTMQLKGMLIPGWTLIDTSCNAQTISGVWSRDWGRIAWLKKSIYNYDIKFVEQVFSPDGKNFVGVSKIDKIVQLNSPPTMTGTQTVDEMNDIFQAIGSEIDLSQEGSEEKVVKGLRIKQKETKHKTVSYKFSSVYDPPMWSALLGKISGLTIDVIDYSAKDGKWNYEGKIYVRKSY